MSHSVFSRILDCLGTELVDSGVEFDLHSGAS